MRKLQIAALVTSIGVIALQVIDAFVQSAAQEQEMRENNEKVEALIASKYGLVAIEETN